ncbi:hypothetical protein P154DRAFT_580900 [Amniculicola lignicola CBS 123094]|uniref:Uncharacterized protein n=1 Tax=Amniculicola lignicola CBS 123094 TaxID=1392246 RepID=A0A6A5W0V4_9PLEO|nr:hypothetical protein P154DRAFT_580900 [Amniculicola lignicola CBS 123094]
MNQHIIVIRTHDKVSQLLIPLLFVRSRTVTSMIRSGEQKVDIEKLGQGQQGKLNVLASSIEDERGRCTEDLRTGQAAVAVSQTIRDGAGCTWQQPGTADRSVLPTYFKAATDRFLTVLTKEIYDDEAKGGVPEKDRFHGISLRPGALTSETAGGVLVGKIPCQKSLVALWLPKKWLRY